MANAFSIGTSALTSLQQALKTTGQNIANVNTEGYSKQTVNFRAAQPDALGNYYVGTGVAVSSVQRAYDQFLTADLQNRTSSSAYYSQLASAAGRVDELFADPATGIGPAMNEFFASMEAVANSPTTLPERQVMISTGETLAQRFDYFNSRLSEFQTELNIQIEASTLEVNRYATTIAELNRDISLQSARTNGNPSGDLLDQRDQAIRELSQLVDTNVQAQDDGALNVFIGKGQPLVVGTIASELSTQPDPLLPERLRISVSPGNTSSGLDVTDLLNGGEIGAAIAASEDVIDQARRDIGVLAAGITSKFNQVHREGFGLEDPSASAGGLDFFDAAALEPQAPTPLGSTSFTLTATIDDPLDATDDNNVADLTGDSYRLDYNAGSLTVRNLITDEVQTLAFNTTTPATFDGVTVAFDSGTLTDGDSFVISPTAKSAALFGVAITDPNDVAAAGVANSPGDNSNLLKLVALQDEGTLTGGASFNDFYTRTTSAIAVQAGRASSLAETESALLASAEARQSNLAGVNLEEEAAKLIQYQQAFQAAAQVVATARDVFDTLIRATQ